MRKLSENRRKLVLSRETLRLLEEREAALVAGGLTVGCTDTCRAACTTIKTTCC
ncbi:MAG TPA: hypothetical protein VIE43_07175 [Thermoanaerobaculia bacterium]|jgi:hypothetical protein|nr:hypothetical protein [Thermoanaerobaculia bacterium]